MSVTTQRRHEIIERFQGEELEIVQTKGREYTLGAEEGNDQSTTANFDNVGQLVKVTCPKCSHHFPVGSRIAWCVYFLKHAFSVLTHASDPDRKVSEPIHGRLLDIRTYAALYECIDENERSAASSKTSEPGPGLGIAPQDPHKEVERVAETERFGPFCTDPACLIEHRINTQCSYSSPLL